jgi:hypothetical protein
MPGFSIFSSCTQVLPLPHVQAAIKEIVKAEAANQVACPWTLGRDLHCGGSNIDTHEKLISPGCLCDGHDSRHWLGVLLSHLFGVWKTFITSALCYSQSQYITPWPWHAVGRITLTMSVQARYRRAQSDSADNSPPHRGADAPRHDAPRQGRVWEGRSR